MQAGLIAAYDAVEIFGSSVADYSFSDALNGLLFSASLTTYWCPDSVDTDPFIEVAWSGTVAVTTGVVSGEVSVSIPPLDIGPLTLSAAALVAASGVSVLLADFRLYQQAAAWYATWSSLTVTIGANVHAYGAGSLVGARLAPTGIPFLGIPPTLAANIGPQAALAVGPIEGSTVVSSHSYAGSASCSGGYQVKELGAGDYSAFPVDVNILLGATTGCPCEPTLLPAISALDTASGSVTSAFSQTRDCVYRGQFSCTVCPDGQTATVPAMYDVWDTTAEQDTCSSSLTVLPNLPKSVQRLGPDYAALLFRGGLPQTTASYSDVCYDYLAMGDTGNVQVQTNPHPGQSSFLGTVTNAPHVIETPFGYATLAPYGWSAIKILATGTAYTLAQAGACPASGIGEGGGAPTPCFALDDTACQGTRVSSFPSAVDDIIANPQLTPGLYHTNPAARYVDYWSAPHWNYAYWFPPDVASGPLQPYEWPLDGARANPSVYWLPARTQWVWNPALTTADATKKRTDLISAPLADGQLAGFWAGFF